MNKISKRYYYNLKILKFLAEFLGKNQYLRFCQLMDIFNRNKSYYFEEPEDTLKRYKERSTPSECIRSEIEISKRYCYNIKILKLLAEFLEENQYLRFCQLMDIMDALKEGKKEDYYFEESENTLRRYEKELLYLKNQKTH